MGLSLPKSELAQIAPGGKFCPSIWVCDSWLDGTRGQLSMMQFVLLSTKP
jgi:hypothetical protein